MVVFIALDDTDNAVSMGTGRLSRMLADTLVRQGLVKNTSVTRHQLLVHPEIPYTSHNSSACIEATLADGSIADIASVAEAFLIDNFHEGANPGLCIVKADSVSVELSAFGLRAQQEVLEIQEAWDKAAGRELHLWSYGETGQGCIGALAGVGLRKTGNDGRFIALAGIRDFGGIMSVSEIRARTAIQRVMSLSGDFLSEEELINTQDWLRPSLHDGQVTLFVMKDAEHWRDPHKKKRKR